MDINFGKILFILILIALIITYIIKGLFWMSVALAAVIIYIIPAYVIIKKIYKILPALRSIRMMYQQLVIICRLHNKRIRMLKL